MGNSRILILAIVLALIAPGHKLAAQSYAGGSFSVSTVFSGLSGEGNSHYLYNTSSLSISPEFGWYLDERMTVGFKPTVEFSLRTDGGRELTLSISPYFRYRFLAFNKFGLWAEGRLNFGYTRTPSNVENEQPIPSINYSVSARPILTYDLSDHICLYGAVNLFSLSIGGSSTYYEERGHWQNTFHFGLSGRTNDVIDSLTNISIGFLYRF